MHISEMQLDGFLYYPTGKASALYKPVTFPDVLEV